MLLTLAALLVAVVPARPSAGAARAGPVEHRAALSGPGTPGPTPAGPVARSHASTPAVAPVTAAPVTPWLAQVDTDAAGLDDPTPIAVDPAPFGAFDADLPERWPTPPQVTAPSFLLADLDTGQVLAARRPDEARPSASTVKVLTAWTALRRADPDRVVTVPPGAVGIEGATAGLLADQQLGVRQLLELVVARSANDAATALAIDLAGSADGFTALMTADAAELGLNVSVDDASGLSDATRLSARQLATITRAAMAEPSFREVAATRAVTQPDGQVVDTRNTLLLDYPGATGVKTGFTDAAGGTLVATAARDGVELVAVVLGSSDVDARFTDAAALLDHGFDRFERRPVQADWTLGVDGPQLGLTADVHVPRDEPGRLRPRLESVPVLLDGLPATAGDRGQPVVVGAGEVDVGGLVAEAQGGSPATTPPGPTSVGGWLVERSQVALRAGAAGLGAGDDVA